MSLAYRVPHAVSAALQQALHDSDGTGNGPVGVLSAREGWSISGPSEDDPGGRLVPSVVATVRSSDGVPMTVVVGRP